MKALEKRRSIRKWKDAPISEQEISNLVWAACGITKSKYGNVKSKRTAHKLMRLKENEKIVLTQAVGKLK
jgi:nitroreductase